MTVDEANHKMDFLKKAYQKLIDENVDSGKLVGDGVMGEWKAETPLDEAYKDMIEALDLVIKALEQQPCEDAISRQAAIDVVRKWFDKIQLNGDICLDGIISLPPVTPQQNMGHWIFHKPFEFGQANCNECIECSQCHTWLGYDCYAKTPYCPICGAKMIKSEVEE